MKPKKGKKMGKYKKEIKHCEKCNKPFSVFPNSTETLCANCKRNNLEETVMHRSICLSGDLMTDSRKRLLSKMPQEGLSGTKTQASRKRAVTAAKCSRLLVQSAFSLNRITWHYPSVARLAVKREKKRGRRTTDGQQQNP